MVRGSFTGRLTSAPPNTTLRLFETPHGRGGLCLDRLNPIASGTVRTDASGQARFDVQSGCPDALGAVR